MTEKETYLFVYGTLRKGFALSIPQTIASDIELVGFAEVKGLLFDIGKYPGAIPDIFSADNFIKGEIVKIKSPQKVFAFLDNYEGYNENDIAGSEYRRGKELLMTENGTTLEAWIYWYNLDVDGKRRISENDYLTYLQKNQLA